MSETASAWSSTVYGLLVHPAAPRVLMARDDDGWVLPHVRLEERLWPPRVGAAVEALRRELGLPLTILRCADARSEDTSPPHVDVTYVLESRAPLEEPPSGGAWIGRASLDGLSPRMARQRAAIEGCLTEAEGGPAPAVRPPWARPGWFASAAAWMEEQLAARGTPCVGPVEQVKTWGISCVLRAGATAGDVYFKAASTRALFADEPSLTAALAALYPAHVPVPLAIDRERGWMLLADFGPTLDATVGRDDPAVRAGWLGTFGQLQRASVGHVDDFLALGCQDRRLHRLAAQVGPLLGDTAALAGLDGPEVARLRALGPRLRAMCRALAGYGVPRTLVHGDLHSGNIAVRDGAYLYFDWTDGCVAHPFFDLPIVRYEAERTPRGDGEDEGWPGLLEGYLASWTAYEPLERLREAWTLAEPLGHLHHAISYQHIRASLEPAQRDFDGMLPMVLRRLLAAML